MLKIRALVVDDEPLARRRIRRLLQAHPEIDRLGECGDGVTAVEAIEKQRPDLIFLDVQMPELDGFGVLQALPDGRRPVIIFVTAYDEYALRAFEVHALDYLLKPIDSERFSRALHRAEAYIQLREESQGSHFQGLAALIEELRTKSRSLKYLLVKESGRTRLVSVETIDWIEAAGKYVRLHAGAEVHILRERLHTLEAKLDPERFLRIHRSAIVNIGRIKELEPAFHGDYAVLLRDGTCLTLSRSYRAALGRLCGGES